MSGEIFCRIRRCRCAKTPEESVRQALLDAAIDTLGFPASLCGVELSQHALMELSNPAGSTLSCAESVLRRRIDVVFFHPQAVGGGLMPMILFECKAVKGVSRPKERAGFMQCSEFSYLLQVSGYAHRLFIPYLGVVKNDQVTLFLNGSLFYAGPVLKMPAWRDLIRAFEDIRDEKAVEKL